jgi:cytidylate kinase
MRGVEGRVEEMLIPHGFSIAVDGPVAAGKGTVAATLAKRVGGFFMNTGGMYRAVALYCIEHGIDTENNESGVSAILPQVNIDIRDGGIFLNDRDVTERIKALDTDRGSSVIAVYGTVRQALVKRQQEIGQAVINQGQIVVAEGRDAGTKIFPEAGIKIFLTASVEERAGRRQIQYAAKGIEKELPEIIAEIKERDERDSTREIDPLQLVDPEKAGYWVLDDSGQKPEQTVEIITQELERRGLVKND